jgi:large repetitive protein
MNNRWMNATLVLTAILISLISISSAAGPRATPDLYSGQCGVELSVPAPGLLANDIPSGKPLHVSAWTAPTVGTLTVDPSGSFIYSQ